MHLVTVPGEKSVILGCSDIFKRKQKHNLIHSNKLPLFDESWISAVSISCSQSEKKLSLFEFKLYNMSKTDDEWHKYDTCKLEFEVEICVKCTWVSIVE